MRRKTTLMVTIGVFVLALGSVANAQELLQNPGFESTDHWDCWAHTCVVTTDHHSGQSGVEARGRHNYWEGPSQFITVQPGQTYSVSGYMKLSSDAGTGQNLQIEVEFVLPDGSHDYVLGATKDNARVSDGWVYLQGGFTVPNRQIRSARFYFQGPAPSCNFVVDEASVQSGGGGTGVPNNGGGGTGVTNHGDGNSGSGIDAIRKSDIHVSITAGAAIDKSKLQIRILQTKKSFPFGSAVNAGRYLDPNLDGYRDFIHKHFNWAVTENALKWDQLEPNRGHYHYEPALNTVNGLRKHGIKVRGHNLVWSVDQFVQGWIKGLYGDELRRVVKDHIQMTMSKTQGLLEHWDVNNENLHGTFYQTRLNDPGYNLELFRMAHANDPPMKLFLNDYNVVAVEASTWDYLHMAQQFKNANVGLYGIGAQCHFGNEEEPNAGAITHRLDILSQAGVPIWITELDVQAQDENRRADFYEKALTAMYSHPNVEGILFWGFWDQQHWRGEKAALVRGNNFEVTAAGRRVIDLFENRWMTDVTQTVASAGDTFTVRGFHGDYEVQVHYNNQERTDLKQTFTLVKNADKSISINVE